MAIAKFHSFRGEKSALILVKANAFVFGWSCAYVPRTALRADIQEGDEITIPDGYRLVDMIGEDGAVRTTKDGECLKVLSY